MNGITGMTELARTDSPKLIMFGPSYDSRDIAARLQVLLDVSLVAGCAAAGSLCLAAGILAELRRIGLAR